MLCSIISFNFDGFSCQSIKPIIHREVFINISGTGCALACTECTCTPGECSWQRCALSVWKFFRSAHFFKGPPGECTFFLRVPKESAHIFSVVCTEYSGPAPRSGCALLFVQSAQVFGRPVNFASSVHSFLLPSAPKFRLRARVPVLAGGPGSGGRGGEGKIHSQ